MWVNILPKLCIFKKITALHLLCPPNNDRSTGPQTPPAWRPPGCVSGPRWRLRLSQKHGKDCQVVIPHSWKMCFCFQTLNKIMTHKNGVYIQKKCQEWHSRLAWVGNGNQPRVLAHDSFSDVQTISTLLPGLRWGPLALFTHGPKHSLAVPIPKGCKTPLLPFGNLNGLKSKKRKTIGKLLFATWGKKMKQNYMICK